MNVLYGPPHNAAAVLPQGGHTPHNHHIYMNPQSRQQSPYMKPYLPGGGGGSGGSLQQASVKRQRTPSPPRPLAAVNSAYYRSAPPLSSHPRIPVSSVYGHPSAPSAGAPPSHAINAAPGGAGPGGSSAAGYPFSVSQNSREEERKQVYLSQPSRFIQQIEAAAGQQQKQPPPFAPDRDRSRLGVGSGGVSHSQAVALSASRAAGSITSGFPRNSPANLASVASSLMNTVATTHPSRHAYTQAAAAAQIAASQAQQNNRYFTSIREH